MHGKNGFTLLELLLAFLVISILGAVAIPTYFSNPHITLEKAGILLARDLRAAQNRAAYFSEPCTFEFLPDGDGYRVTDRDGDILIHQATQLEFVRRYSEDGVFEGVKLLSVEAGPEQKIHYRADGRPTTGATVTIGFEGRIRVLKLDAATGRVELMGTTSGFVDRGY